MAVKKATKSRRGAVREYYDTWQQIKEVKSLVIKANPQYHKRIKKALAKEKDRDTSWPEKRYFALRSQVLESDPTKIRFYLALYRKSELAGDSV